MTDRMFPSLPPSPSLAQPVWVRANDGLVFGVCTALARRLGLAPWVVRALWLMTVFVFGTGLLAYLVLAVSLPRERDYVEAQHNRVLGVCADIARRTGMEVGLIRFLAVIFGVASFGATVVAYFVLYAVMDQRNSFAA
jgi:phage shock protein PspC (stress-responsive transcriptional regulator)